MVRVLTIVGVRPQFIKAAAVSAALQRHGGFREKILHTGQHYDETMSAVFFDELGIPRPDAFLEVGSGTQARQTGAIMAGVEDVLTHDPPDWVVVYGDTNSTLGAVLAAVKLHLPVAHVEAGMRSFNRRMPEELNRIVCDHMATLHFCSSETAARNLANEGVREGVHMVGDVMTDCARLFYEGGNSIKEISARHGVEPKAFALLTWHRDENTRDRERMRSILQGVATVSERMPVLFPAHPRILRALEATGLALPPRVRRIAPVGYLDMLALEKASSVILTDSGGVQKEAFYARTPCVTLRDDTEWVETVQSGWNRLAGADGERIAEAALRMADRTFPLPPWPGQLYGDGYAADRLAGILWSSSVRRGT